MDLISIIFIAFGLAMDAFAVSITCGFTISSPKRWKALKIAFSFGFFQALMPIIGWLAGKTLSIYIKQFDHWVAFGLLTFIGIRMIYKAADTKTDYKTIVDPSNNPMLLMLSIATSIDALAVGVTFAFLHVNIFLPVLIIGIITFFISTFGLLIGHKLGDYLGKRFEIIGGFVLIGIGIKILIEHLNIF